MSRESCIKVLQDVFERDMACMGITLTHEALEAVIEYLKDVPTAAVQPVQRGHWQEAKTRTYGIYECDVCKGWTYIPNKPRDYKFCPRCGARMDGDKNG